jgi:hypothetical protein
MGAEAWHGVTKRKAQRLPAILARVDIRLPLRALPRGLHPHLPHERYLLLGHVIRTRADEAVRIIRREGLGGALGHCMAGAYPGDGRRFVTHPGERLRSTPRSLRRSSVGARRNAPASRVAGAVPMRAFLGGRTAAPDAITPDGTMTMAHTRSVTCSGMLLRRLRTKRPPRRFIGRR